MDLDAGLIASDIAAADGDLTNDAVPPHARPLLATISLLHKYGISGALVANANAPMAPITEMNLCSHVHAWYEEKYGPALKISLSPGRFPILVSSSVHACVVPFLLGDHLVLAARERLPEGASPINAVDFVANLTSHLRSQLADSDCEEIKILFYCCVCSGNRLRNSQDSLLSSAMTDFDASCDSLATHRPNAGLSAWHSLQATEKVLKSFIAHHRSFPYTHDITTLRDIALACGYCPGRSPNWPVFNFGPSVRYDPSAKTVAEAVAVNHESWRVCADVLGQS